MPLGRWSLEDEYVNITYSSSIQTTSSSLYNTENRFCLDFSACSFSLNSFSCLSLWYCCRLSSFYCWLSLSFSSFFFLSSSFFIISRVAGLSAGPGQGDEVLFFCFSLIFFLWCLFFIFCYIVTCLCFFVFWLCLFVASARLNCTCIGLNGIKLIKLFSSLWERYVLFTFNFNYLLFFLPCSALLWVGRVVTGTVCTSSRSLTLTRWAMFRHTTVGAYSLSATLVFMVAKDLKLIAPKWVRNVHINFCLNETNFYCWW